MKIKCSKANLLKGINIVSKAVPSRTTMEILTCILIDASTDEIKLTANDNELGIETIVEGQIAERGIIALDSKILMEMVRRMPDNEILIESDPSLKTQISCEKARFNIVGKSGEDFSYIPYLEKSQPIIISQFTLKEMIRQTIFSIADNENNKIMTGELFEIDNNLLKMVSLDGHRISIRTVITKDCYERRKVIIPGKTLLEISKIIPGNLEDDVYIYLTKNYVIFDFETTTVVSRLIEGEYFKIDQMLSANYNTRLTINRKELLDCIDRASLMVKEGDKKPIIMDINREIMTLSIRSSLGSMNETIDIAKDGEDLMIAFNPRFFIDALRAIDEERITLYLVNAKAPCFIRDDEGRYIYLVLPVNFNNV